MASILTPRSSASKHVPNLACDTPMTSIRSMDFPSLVVNVCSSGNPGRLSKDKIGRQINKLTHT